MEIMIVLSDDFLIALAVLLDPAGQTSFSKRRRRNPEAGKTS